MKTITLEKQQEAASRDAVRKGQRQSPPRPAGDVPSGWSYNPSAWSQRVPMLALAGANALIALYLGICQAGYGGRAWDPLFGGETQRVLTSDISRAFPIPDALLGAAAYLLETLSFGIGGPDRWRTKPWLILSFALLTVPLFLTSLTLVILQPIVLHAWCSLCLLVALNMFLLLPLALDEVIAAGQLLARQQKAGQSLWQTFWHGAPAADETPLVTTTQPFSGIAPAWNLLLLALLGAALLGLPALRDIRGEAAESLWIVGAITLAFGLAAWAEAGRALRLLVVPGALWLIVFAPWTLTGASAGDRVLLVAAGVILLLLSLPRGGVRGRYAGWQRYIL